MRLLAGGNIFRARIDRGLKYGIFGRGLSRKFNNADMIEHEGDGAGLGQRSARLAEIRAHFARGAIAVVGQRLDDDRDAARRIALVTHLVVVLRNRRQTPS